MTNKIDQLTKLFSQVSKMVFGPSKAEYRVVLEDSVRKLNKYRLNVSSVDFLNSNCGRVPNAAVHAQDCVQYLERGEMPASLPRQQYCMAF